jgi:8-oxo-dGTP pyrophosphatase MutT (NUDIX family)
MFEINLVDIYDLVAPVESQNNRIGDAYSKGNSVYVCISTENEFLCAERRKKGYWFENYSGINAFRARGARRGTFLEGTVLDIWDPERRGSSLKPYQRPTRDYSFCLPGGRALTNETIYATARREMLEETGLDIDSLTPWRSNVYAKSFARRDPWATIFYVLYVHISFAQMADGNNLLTLMQWKSQNPNGIINAKFLSDDNTFRANLAAYYQAAGNGAQGAALLADVAPPNIPSDELCDTGGVKFTEVHDTLGTDVDNNYYLVAVQNR